MPGADAASRKYEWENSVSRFCQVKNRFVEPHIDEASNIMSCKQLCKVSFRK